MIFTLVLIAIGVLLFLVIGYNIVLQYKQKQQADQRAAIARQKTFISESEDLLLNSARLPYSTEIMLILHKRIMHSLQQIKRIDPDVKGLTDRLGASQNQISQLQDRGFENNQQLRIPDNDAEAVQMLKVIKRLRAVIRSEHARGRIATSIFVAEDRKLELMILKVNIENTIKRALESQAMRQWGSSRQLLNKAISVLNGLSDRDEYLEQRLAQMRQMNDDMSEKLKKVQTKQKEDKEKEMKEQDELDVIFQPKKKW
ncbi:DNA repair protein [Celerinatantimonas yamalensis]|uniref:DNA repair protein n=1 Tax=Celerinatantimonas yamalensis TaxID=559956 RepID=A0ABW9G4C3_9GAMM